MVAPIGWLLIEWWHAGGRVDTIVAAKKGRLRGADVIREPCDISRMVRISPELP